MYSHKFWYKNGNSLSYIHNDKFHRIRLGNQSYSHIGIP